MLWGGGWLLLADVNRTQRAHEGSSARFIIFCQLIFLFISFVIIKAIPRESVLFWLDTNALLVKWKKTTTSHRPWTRRLWKDPNWRQLCNVRYTLSLKPQAPVAACHSPPAEIRNNNNNISTWVGRTWFTTAAARRACHTITIITTTNNNNKVCSQFLCWAHCWHLGSCQTCPRIWLFYLRWATAAIVPQLLAAAARQGATGWACRLRRIRIQFIRDSKATIRDGTTRLETPTRTRSRVRGETTRRNCRATAATASTTSILRLLATIASLTLSCPLAVQAIAAAFWKMIFSILGSSRAVQKSLSLQSRFSQAFLHR